MAQEMGTGFETLLHAVRAAFAAVPQAAPFLADWPDTTERRVLAPQDLPVTAHLPGMAAPAATAPALAALQAAAPGLAWRQTYAVADLGAAFLAGYGWSEFIGLRGPVPSTRLACGVLLLAPGIRYPLHRHEAEELYLPISGTALWRMGSAPAEAVPPGRPIHHPSWMPHGTETGPEPLAALYLWRGGDLAAKSELL